MHIISVWNEEHQITPNFPNSQQMIADNIKNMKNSVSDPEWCSNVCIQPLSLLVASKAESDLYITLLDHLNTVWFMWDSRADI